MAGFDERKELNVTLGDGPVDVAIFLDRLTRADAFVWRKQASGSWVIVGQLRNQSRRIRLSSPETLKGTQVELAFEVFGDAQSGETPYDVSGQIEQAGTIVQGSQHRFAGRFEGNLHIAVIAWSFA